MNRRNFIRGAALAAMCPGTTAAAVVSRPRSGVVRVSREVPLKATVDVFVAGGGPAGVAAAVSAAQTGARVFLVESQGACGGMSTSGLVPVFMGFGDGVNTLSAGFATQVRTRLSAERGLEGPANDFEALKRVYDALLTETKVDFCFQTKLVDVVTEGDRIVAAVCSGPSGLWAVRAKAFVDATGNADLAFAAGAHLEKGDDAGRVMPGTLCSVWTDFDWERWNRERPTKPKTFRGWADFVDAALADGVFLEPDRHVTGFERLGKNLAAANMGHAFNLDPTDERSVTQAYVRCRAQMKEWQRYFREYVKRGTENIRLVATGDLLGVRESRRLVADYTLSVEDYANRASFEDEIGRYSYPIDIHPATGTKADMEKFHRTTAFKKYGRGESYGIPYRSLVAKGYANLLAAGRCMGTDPLMQASVRVIPCCYITGQAAGIAAALSVRADGDVRSVKYADLARQIVSLGGWLRTKEEES